MGSAAAARGDDAGGRREVESFVLVVVDQGRHLCTGGVDVGYAEAVVVDERKVV